MNTYIILYIILYKWRKFDCYAELLQSQNKGNKKYIYIYTYIVTVNMHGPKFVEAYKTAKAKI